MTTTKRRNDQASASALPTPRRARAPVPGGPVPERERTARYRARKQELEDRVPFNALISREALHQIKQMCEGDGKQRTEVLEKIIAQAYARFMKRSGGKA